MESHLELCQITNNQINHNLIKIIQLSLTIFRFMESLPPMGGWVDGHFLLDFFFDMDLETILRPYLVIFDICHFLTISGPFEYFQKMGALRKSKFSQLIA